MIDLTSFRQTIERLGEILERYQREPDDLAVQDSVAPLFYDEAKYLYDRVAERNGE